MKTYDRVTLFAWVLKEIHDKVIDVYCVWLSRNLIFNLSLTVYQVNKRQISQHRRNRVWLFVSYHCHIYSLPSLQRQYLFRAVETSWSNIQIKFAKMRAFLCSSLILVLFIYGSSSGIISQSNGGSDAQRFYASISLEGTYFSS